MASAVVVFVSKTTSSWMPARWHRARSIQPGPVFVTAHPAVVAAVGSPYRQAS